MICTDCLPVFYTPEDLGAIPETADWAAMRGDADGEAWLRHIAGGRG